MTFSRKLVALAAGLVLSSCGLGQDILLNSGPPVIAYATPVTYTVGVATFHGVQSTGGPVTSFTVSPSLPQGLSLNASTGALGGVALAAAATAEYAVIAEGPGGRDTAFVSLAAVTIPVDPAVARPEIAYASPVTDTAGRPATHAVISTGGPVTGFATSYTLPAGLTLDAATGRIAGTPTGPSSAFAFPVIAFGPGGRDTAVIVLTVVANPAVARPQIAYASPVTDTVGRPATHAVLSTGGPVTRYELYISDALVFLPVVRLAKPQFVIWPDPFTLPAGLSLNTTTGRISGTPTQAKEVTTYTIIASGPGGIDTATFTLAVVDTSTTPRPGPDPVLSGIALSVTLTPTAAPLSLPVDFLEKPAAISLDRMIVTFSSNLNDTIRDTIRAGTQGFRSDGTATQIFEKLYGTLPPLRWWNVSVQTRDVQGVAVYAGSGGPFAGGLGELVPVALTLSPRFVPYRAAFTFADTIGFSGISPVRGRVNVTRIVLVVSGDTVRDTTAPIGSRFAPLPAITTLEYDYLSPGFSHPMALYLYGNVSYAASGSYLLYSATFNHTPTALTHSPALTWVGPQPAMGGPGF